MPTDHDQYWRLRPPPPTPDDELCACTSLTPIVLQPHLSANPLSCACCNLEVPPERIGFDERVADWLAAWRDFHASFYLLWLDSGEFEEWAKGQLSGPTSAVNTRGLELVAQMNVFRRCYLWWFQDEGAEDWQPAKECPRCVGVLQIRFKGERPQCGALAVCESCSIAFAV